VLSDSRFYSAPGQWQTHGMAEPTTSKIQNAAQATEQVEQRIATVRGILASFTPGDINRHSFYSEPFARQSGLGRAAREIKAAVQIIGDTAWPDEDEAAAAVPIAPQIAKLRQQCSAELRTMNLYFRDCEDMADACADPQLLARLLHGLTDLRQSLSRLSPTATKEKSR
jgi:hypothetical protein